MYYIERKTYYYMTSENVFSDLADLFSDLADLLSNVL